MAREQADATSQHHGKVFERLIRDSGRFPGAVGSKSSESDAIDIEARYDEALDLHTSVKTTGDGWIGLADAIRFYEIDRPFRIVAGRWRQKTPKIKSLHTVAELIVTLRTLRRLHGGLTLEDIRQMHAEYASFPAGTAGKAEAKKAADRMIKAAASRIGLVRLDFKGDDLAQRRLQLSIKLDALINAVSDDPVHLYRGHSVPTCMIERSWYHALSLPVEIESTPRRFRDPMAGSTLDLGTPTAPAPMIDGIMPSRPLVRHDDKARRLAANAADPMQPRLIA